MLTRSKFWFFTVALLTLSFLQACTYVYLEKPMPQSGVAANRFPEEWFGLYQAEEDPEASLSDPGSLNAFFTECYRIAPAGKSKVLISTESRIRKSDFPKLERWLEGEQRNGRLSDYVLNERFILLQEMVKEDSAGTHLESQSVALHPDGEWLVWGSASAPLYLYNFDNQYSTSYEKMRKTHISESDSVKIERRIMKALEKDGALYLNFKEGSFGLWDWLHLRSPRAGVLIATMSSLENPDQFKAEIERYNKITPFTKMEEGRDAYRIDPSDAAFEVLLAEQDFFNKLILKKIE
jgi:hypothetical protein